MLLSIDIRNYRSCIDTQVQLQPDLTVLIGPNGAGKTNILQALMLLKQSTNLPMAPFRADSLFGTENECTLAVQVKSGGKSLGYRSKLIVDSTESNTDEIIDAEEFWEVGDFTGSGKPIFLPSMLGMQLTPHARDDHMYWTHSFAMRRGKQFHPVDTREMPAAVKKPIGEAVSYFHDLKYYGASQFTSPSRCPISFEFETLGETERIYSHRPDRPPLEKFLFDLFVSYKNARRSTYDTFIQIVGPNGIGLVKKISFTEMAVSSIDYRVHSGGHVRKVKKDKSLVVPQFYIGNNVLSPSQLSEGTFKTLTLLFYLITDKSSALFIEEPEVCVHHGLLLSIMELIHTYSKTKQILLTTHSDFVLDQVVPRNVCKVQWSAKFGTKVDPIDRALNKADLDALKMYLMNQGNLGEYWRHGGLE